jgi:hypothetical protein
VLPGGIRDGGHRVARARPPFDELDDSRISVRVTSPRAAMTVAGCPVWASTTRRAAGEIGPHRALIGVVGIGHVLDAVGGRARSPRPRWRWSPGCSRAPGRSGRLAITSASNSCGRPAPVHSRECSPDAGGGRPPCRPDCSRRCRRWRRRRCARPRAASPLPSSACRRG